MLGTLDYMAPEQAQDASTVDIRADIYGLGGTLFWCLDRQTPFPLEGSIVAELVARRRRSRRRRCAGLSRLPAELDAVVRA